MAANQCGPMPLPGTPQFAVWFACISAGAASEVGGAVQTVGAASPWFANPLRLVKLLVGAVLVVGALFVAFSDAGAKVAAPVAKAASAAGAA